MQLYVDDSIPSLVVQLVQKLSGVEVKTSKFSEFKGDSSKKPPVLDNGKGVVEGVLPISTSLLANSANATLLGSQEKQKEFDSWLKTLLNDFVPSSITKDNKYVAKLHKFNKDIQPSVFFLGNTLTLVDLIVYVTIYNSVKQWSAADRLTFSNLTRWFDNIQHIQGIENALPQLPTIFINRCIDAEEYVAAASQKPTKGAPAKQEAAKATEAPKEAPKAAAPAKDTKKPEQKEQKEAQPKKEQQQDGKQEKKQPEKKKQDGQGKGQGQGQGQGKGQGQGQGKGQKGAAVKKAEGPVDVSRLDLRVGKILHVEKHPEADALYVEKVDVGEEKPRQVVSGLVKFIPIDEMKDRMVVLLCNLKPSKLRGVTSEAMVFAASNSDHTQVELLDPPAGTKIGEKITFDGFQGEPETGLHPKHKVWEAVQPDLKTNDECVATYKGVPFKTSTGVCRVKTLKQATIK